MELHAFCGHEGDCGKRSEVYKQLWECLGCLYAIEGRGEICFSFFFFCFLLFFFFFSKNNKDF